MTEPIKSRYWLAKVKPHNVKSLYDSLPNRTILYIDRLFLYQDMDMINIVIVYPEKRTIQTVNALPISNPTPFSYYDKKAFNYTHLSYRINRQ